jgi:hypothetical protein
MLPPTHQSPSANFVMASCLSPIVDLLTRRSAEAIASSHESKGGRHVRETVVSTGSKNRS